MTAKLDTFGLLFMLLAADAVHADKYFSHYGLPDGISEIDILIITKQGKQPRPYSLPSSPPREQRDYGEQPEAGADSTIRSADDSSASHTVEPDTTIIPGITMDSSDSANLNRETALPVERDAQPAMDDCGAVKKYLTDVSVTQCRYTALQTKSNSAHKYLYGAFLNLRPGMSGRALKPATAKETLPAISSERHLLVLKKGKEKIGYLLYHPGKSYPVAGGEVGSPFDRHAVISIFQELKSGRTLKMTHREISSMDGSLDFFIDGGIGAIFMLSSDEPDDPNNPFDQEVEKPDLNDFINHKGMPYFFRLGVRFIDIITLRLSWKHSFYTMKSRAISGLPVSKWDISRNDIKGDLLIGKTLFIADDLPVYVYGLGGLGQVFHNDMVKYTDGTSASGEIFLEDVMLFNLGAGAQLRPAKGFAIGLELGFLFKDFATVGPNPEGTGNEIFAQIFLSGLYKAK